MAKIKAEIVISVNAIQERYINASPARQLRIRQERAEMARLAAWRKANILDDRESNMHPEPLHDSHAMRDWYLRYNSIPKGILV